MIEWIFRSLKEECVWLQNVDDFHQARRKVRDWIAWYGEARPRQSLGYLSPVEFGAQHHQRAWLDFRGALQSVQAPASAADAALCAAKTAGKNRVVVAPRAPGPQR